MVDPVLFVHECQVESKLATQAFSAWGMPLYEEVRQMFLTGMPWVLDPHWGTNVWSPRNYGN